MIGAVNPTFTRCEEDYRRFTALLNCWFDPRSRVRSAGRCIEHAAALAKRAMASQERIMLEIIEQLTVSQVEPAIVNVINLLEEVQ